MTEQNIPSGGPPGSSPLDPEVQKEIDAALGDQTIEQLMADAETPPPPDAGADAPAAAHADAAKHSAHSKFVHDIARGRIISVSGDDVFVELTGMGGKNQGVVSLAQFERPPRPGSIMDFVVDRFEEAEGLYILSREGAVSRATWEQLQRGAIVEARVIAHNKGGLELEMIGGIRAFMPASQIDLHHVDRLEDFVGQKLQAMVQDIDRRSRKVVLSRRHHLEQERERKQGEIFERLEPGQTCDGKITSVVEYGAFVDIGGIDGLIHVSDLSYSRVDRPADFVKVGQTVTVKVLKIDKEKKRISLGLKQVAPDPWEAAVGRLAPGQQVTGKVLRLADFGAFVEILPGVEGLLPISEISFKRIAKPADVLKEGESYRLTVLQLDPAKRRLSLSLKQAGPDPWIGASHKYARHAIVEATVLSTTDFGAFCEVEPGLEGMVHISELSDRRVNAVTDVVKPGQKHKVRVLEVDEDKRRMRLSIKAVNKEPVEEQPAEPVEPAAKPKRRTSGKNLKSGLGASAALGMGLGDLKL